MLKVFTLIKAYAKDGQDANSFSSDDEYILHACYEQDVVQIEPIHKVCQSVYTPILTEFIFS